MLQIEASHFQLQTSTVKCVNEKWVISNDLKILSVVINTTPQMLLLECKLYVIVCIKYHFTKVKFVQNGQLIICQFVLQMLF